MLNTSTTTQAWVKNIAQDIANQVPGQHEQDNGYVWEDHIRQRVAEDE